MRIKLISASDRNNYGDLLFPLIFMKFIKDYSKVQFDNYGIKQSDLSGFGALKTNGLGDLINDLKANNPNSDKIKLVVAGGEVLGGGWLNILRFLSPFWNKIHKVNSIRSRLEHYKVLEMIYELSKKSKYPFVFNKLLEESNLQIYYNSVGALGVSGVLIEEKVRHYFDNVKHLSVRDKASQQSFYKYDIDSILVPDSAIIISDIFKKELIEFETEKLKEVKSQDYIVLQLGKTKGPDDLNKFSAVYLDIMVKTGLKIVLCPIGFAMDHEDEQILKKLFEVDNRFIYFSPKNIFEIMILIKGATLFAGTSLHGIITAQSFNVPFIAYSQKIKKLEYYVSSWIKNPDKHIADFYDANKIKKLLVNFDFESYMESTNNQKKLVYQNLQYILSDE